MELNQQLAKIRDCAYEKDFSEVKEMLLEYDDIAVEYLLAQIPYHELMPYIKDIHTPYLRLIHRIHPLMYPLSNLLFTFNPIHIIKGKGEFSIGDFGKEIPSARGLLEYIKDLPQTNYVRWIRYCLTILACDDQDTIEENILGILNATSKNFHLRPRTKNNNWIRFNYCDQSKESEFLETGVIALGKNYDNKYNYVCDESSFWDLDGPLRFMQDGFGYMHRFSKSQRYHRYHNHLHEEMFVELAQQCLIRPPDDIIKYYNLNRYHHPICGYV